MNSSDCLKANLSEPKITRRVALMGAAASVFPSAWSQVRDAYRIVVPFPAGGGMDSVARVLGNHLGSKLKQTVVVENRPGAGGAIGTQYVRQQNGTGNIALITTASFVATPLLNPGANYNPVADFQPICGIFDSYAFVISSWPKACRMLDGASCSSPWTSTRTASMTISTSCRISAKKPMCPFLLPLSSVTTTHRDGSGSWRGQRQPSIRAAA